MRSTLADVARRAGVSVASVSRVLNGLPASSATAERIRQAADELRYLPDLAARSLKIGRTEQVSLMVDDLGNPAYISMMRGVEAVLRAAHYRLQLTATGSEADLGMSTAIHTVSRGYADGLIICPLRINDELIEVLKSSPIPVVVIGTLPRGVRLDNVTVDSAHGVHLGMQHLFEQGRRRIAFLGGPVDTNPGSRRLAGYLAAVKDMALPEDPDLRVFADAFTYEAAIPAVDLLTARTSFDALMAANDVMAVGGLRSLDGHHRRVPEDVAVIGVDDCEVTAYTNPTLSSIDLGAERRGADAARLLLRRLADPTATIRRVRETPRLHIRGSSSTQHPSPAHSGPAYSSLAYSSSASSGPAYSGSAHSRSAQHPEGSS